MGKLDVVLDRNLIPEHPVDDLDGIPRVDELLTLAAMCDWFDVGTGTEDDIGLLARIGTSQGGARPKVSNLSSRGRLAVAKLPSKIDTRDVLAWEATALELARRSGIDTPTFRHHRLDEHPSALTAERFDRDPDGHHLGCLSAHTLTGTNVGDTVGYGLLADALSTPGDGPEVFRRMAFARLIENGGDHSRNHHVPRTSTGRNLGSSSTTIRTRVPAILVHQCCPWRRSRRPRHHPAAPRPRPLRCQEPRP